LTEIGFPDELPKDTLLPALCGDRRQPRRLLTEYLGAGFHERRR